MENLQACFRLTAQLLDNKRTGKQRVEAMQLLNILLGRNPDSSWKRHPVLQMWQPWSEALKLYYNCFLEEWMARGFVNNLPLEVINEEALTEQGVPPFLSNKHFVDRHRANLMTKHPDFYEARKYEWGVEPREGYYWYLDGVYILTKYGKRFESDLSGDQAPPEPEPPVRKRKPRVKKEVKEVEVKEEEEAEDEKEEKKKKRKKDRKTKVKKEEGARGNDDDDFMPPKKPKRRREVKVKVEKNEEDEEDVVNNVSEKEKGKEREDDEAEEQPLIKTEEDEEEESTLQRRAKRKPAVSELVASFAFSATTTTRRVAKRTKRGDAALLSADHATTAALDRR